MFRVIEIPKGGPPRETTFDQVSVSDDRHYWIDLCNATDDELEQLRVKFNFHPLAIDDCKTFDQRPKLEEFGDHLFIVIHQLRCLVNADEIVTTHELHSFLSLRYLVTVHVDDLELIRTLWEKTLRDNDAYARGVGFTYYTIADRVADANFNALDVLSESLEKVEDELLQRKPPNKLPHLFEIKRALSTMRRILSPQRDLFSVLAGRAQEWIPERTTIYFRDVHDKLIRISEALEWCRDLLSNLLEAHFSVLSNRTNEIMKHLTLLSSIFLPLTFVTGFFGQNFTHIPFESTPLMWVGIGACLALPITMIVWFKARRWL